MGLPILDAFVDFVFDNLIFVGAMGLALFYGYKYINLKKSISVKIIDRADIERKKFIKRMEFNLSNKFRWLYRGSVNKKLIGKITRYMESVKLSNEDKKKINAIRTKITPIDEKILEKLQTLVKIDRINEGDKFKELNNERWVLVKEKNALVDDIEKLKIRLISMVVQPCLFGGRLTNPLAKPNVIVLQDDGGVIKKAPDIYINETLGIANYVGVYHSIGKKETAVIENIRETDFRQTDLDNMASIYFAKAQEQSTFDPVYAHQMAMEQRKLEVELAKRKGKAESV